MHKWWKALIVAGEIHCCVDPHGPEIVVCCRVVLRPLSVGFSGHNKLHTTVFTTHNFFLTFMNKPILYNSLFNFHHTFFPQECIIPLLPRTISSPQPIPHPAPHRTLLRHICGSAVDGKPCRAAHSRLQQFSPWESTSVTHRQHHPCPALNPTSNGLPNRLVNIERHGQRGDQAQGRHC